MEVTIIGCCQCNCVKYMGHHRSVLINHYFSTRHACIHSKVTAQVIFPELILNYIGILISLILKYD